MVRYTVGLSGGDWITRLEFRHKSVWIHGTGWDSQVIVYNREGKKSISIEFFNLEYYIKSCIDNVFWVLSEINQTAIDLIFCDPVSCTIIITKIYGKSIMGPVPS